jgi:hypothetical protein
MEYKAVGDPVNCDEAWDLLVEWLPTMLSGLLESEAYGYESRPPADQRGVYLFSEAGEHLYVGRTGITARSRASGRPPITSFRHRFDQHTQMGRPPAAAALAHRLTRQTAEERGVPITPKWWKHRRGDGKPVYDLFCEAKDRVGSMEFRKVAFDDDLAGVRSSIAEIYAHTHLQTRFNDFLTS